MSACTCGLDTGKKKTPEGARWSDVEHSRTDLCNNLGEGRMGGKRKNRAIMGGTGLSPKGHRRGGKGKNPAPGKGVSKETLN